jgi:hypothetical protein
MKRYLKNIQNTQKRAGGVAQGVECKREALSLNLSTSKKKKKERRKGKISGSLS